MEMDAIFRFYSFCDVTATDFFHEEIAREIGWFAIEENEEVRMPVDLVWSWCEDISDSYSDGQNKGEPEEFEKCFHVVRVKILNSTGLFIRLPAP